MRVSWLSGRVLGNDLCGTTQSSLADGLVELGHEVFLYSPGRISTSKFHHIPLQNGRIKGLHSWTVVRALRSNIEEINKSEHVLIDWRLHAITPFITTKWTLIDRGPPADRGILSLLQWKQWAKGWNKAACGTAVSRSHANFIHKRTGMPLDGITILHAGVDVDKFSPGVKSGILKMVYQGRVDRHRGVLLLPKILIALHNRGIKASLNIHGEGDALNKLKQMKIPELFVTSSLDSAELASRQSEYDIGFLPMPKDKVWELASPLKRSEYLASGLVICGIDHPGHRLPQSGEWLQLYSEEKFVEHCCEWLVKIERKQLNKLQNTARKYAETHLSWAYSTKLLEESMLE